MQKPRNRSFKKLKFFFTKSLSVSKTQALTVDVQVVVIKPASS